MHQSSRYVEALPGILAALHGEQDKQEICNPPAEQGAAEPETIHIYPIEGGALLLSRIPLAQERPSAPIVESSLTHTERCSQPSPQRRPLHPVVHQVLLLFLFLLLDSTTGILTELMMPTVTITLVPEVQSITLQSSARLGKRLAPVTVSQSQNAATTGHGHQDARSAEGTLTFYNAAFTAQTVAMGTVLTASDGVEVVSDAAVTIAANAPPSDGIAQVLAHALQKGAPGNIAALALNTALSTTLYVKNLTPFHGGQDKRDYRVVSKIDLDTAASALKQKVTASMTVAFQQQLTPGEQLERMACPLTVSADHRVGDEANRVQVRVSQTCTAIVYDSRQLTALATGLLRTQAQKTLGQGYKLSGEARVAIMKAQLIQQSVVLSFHSQANFVYQINEARLIHLLTGQPRLMALRLLTHLAGIKRASINGVVGNQELPTDPTHLHLLFVVVAT